VHPGKSKCYSNAMTLGGSGTTGVMSHPWQLVTDGSKHVQSVRYACALQISWPKLNLVSYGVHTLKMEIRVQTSVAIFVPMCSVHSLRTGTVEKRNNFPPINFLPKHPNPTPMPVGCVIEWFRNLFVISEVYIATNSVCGSCLRHPCVICFVVVASLLFSELNRPAAIRALFPVKWIRSVDRIQGGPKQWALK